MIMGMGWELHDHGSLVASEQHKVSVIIVCPIELANPRGPGVYPAAEQSCWGRGFGGCGRRPTEGQPLPIRQQSQEQRRQRCYPQDCPQKKFCCCAMPGGDPRSTDGGGR